MTKEEFLSKIPETKIINGNIVNMRKSLERHFNDVKKVNITKKENE